MNDDYEFEERAAIREFDGGQPKGTAEFFAREEIAIRKAQQNTLNHHRQYEKQQQNETRKIQQPVPEKSKSQVQSLRDQRDKIGKQMVNEKDPKRKTELFVEWQELIKEIGIVEGV